MTPTDRSAPLLKWERIDHVAHLIRTSPHGEKTRRLAEMIDDFYSTQEARRG